MTILKTKPLTTPFGKEVVDFDPAKLNDAAARELKELLDENQLLVFKRLNLNASQQEQLMKAFGPVASEEGNGVFHTFVSNARPDGLFGENPIPFHTDFLYTADPTPICSLYGDEVDGTSMPTTFCSNVEAVKALPPDLKSRLTGLKVVHAVSFTESNQETKKDRSDPYATRVRLLKMKEIPSETDYPRHAWDLIARHPRTGKQYLCASQTTMSHIEGRSDEEGEAIIHSLKPYLYAEKNVFVHHWEKGDLVVWDCLALQHGRQALPDGVQQSRRTLRRVTVHDKTVAEMVGGAKYSGARTGGFRSLNA